MKKVRKILYPFSVLYGQITKARNKMFDKGILKSTRFDIPVIVVGNLSVGGTGKTPQIEYLIRLLKETYKIAVLSRGYKRKTKGFVIADASLSPTQIGDEPYQYYSKFKDVIIAVDADRVNGINKLKSLQNPPEIILLDDAFQHRKVTAGFNILLTPYNDLYVDDAMLPSGNLREQVVGAERAQVIVVTKCPKELQEEKQFEIAKKLQPTLYQTVFFSTINYANFVKNATNRIAIKKVKDYKVLLVTGIANAKPLCSFLTSKNIQFEHLKYKDHYSFSEKDIDDIKTSYEKIVSEKKIILTTEKDYVKLHKILPIYFLEIEVDFIKHGKDFNEKIMRYVEESTRNN